MKWPWDKFGIRVARPKSDPMQRNPDVILDCLKLKQASGVRVDFYDSIGRAIVTVNAADFQESLQNTRIASRQSMWDVEDYTPAMLDQVKEVALRDFTSLAFVSPELAQALVDHGYFTFDDLSVIDPQLLMHLGGIDKTTADAIIEQSDIRAGQMAG